MCPGAIDSLENMSLTELVGLVGGLIGEVERLREENGKLKAGLATAKCENQQLKDEVRRLKGLPPRPPMKPSGMEKAQSGQISGQIDQVGLGATRFARGEISGPGILRRAPR